MKNLTHIKIKPTFIKNENHKESRIKILKKITDLLEGSTSHGIPNIVRTNRISIKILWTLCFLISVSFCSFMVFRSVNDYLQLETVSKIEYITEIPTKFPTISFCNLNPFVTNYSEQWMIRILPELRFNDSLEKLNSLENIQYLFLANLATQLYVYQEDFSDEERKKFGFNLSELLIGSEYNEETLKIDEFKSYYDLRYGNCFSFNSGYDKFGNKSKIKECVKPGPKDGLSFRFFLRPSENKYSAGIHEGLRVFIHNNSINPSSLMGVSVEPSKKTEISIQRTFISKEPYPYSDCINLENFDSYYYRYLVGLNNSYRQQDCFNLCLQEKVLKNCGCYDINYPNIYNSAPCLDLVKYNCTLNIYYDFKKSKIDDECLNMCPLECESIRYDLQISNARPLSEHGYNIYKNVFNNFTAKYLRYNFSYEEIEKRLIVLNIYYSDMTYIKISESPKISFIDLLSNLGGTLGLYIGISFLSLIEIVEIILEIIFISFNLNI